MSRSVAPAPSEARYTEAMHRLVMNRSIYTDFVETEVPSARRTLWIVTADIKDLHVESEGRFRPFLDVLDALVRKGVAVRLIHAREPGPRFREDFDRCSALVNSDLFERILCPRVHTKAIVVDDRLAFVGSANLTGAGLGAKHADKRNFEAGFIFDDRQHIDELVSWIDSLYLGNWCHSCRRRQYCPDPIADDV